MVLEVLSGIFHKENLAQTVIPAYLGWSQNTTINFIIYRCLYQITSAGGASLKKLESVDGVDILFE